MVWYFTNLFQHSRVLLLCGMFRGNAPSVPVCMAITAFTLANRSSIVPEPSWNRYDPSSLAKPFLHSYRLAFETTCDPPSITCLIHVTRLDKTATYCRVMHCLLLHQQEVYSSRAVLWCGLGMLENCFGNASVHTWSGSILERHYNLIESVPEWNTTHLHYTQNCSRKVRTVPSC